MRDAGVGVDLIERLGGDKDFFSGGFHGFGCGDHEVDGVIKRRFDDGALVLFEFLIELFPKKFDRGDILWPN